MKKMILLIILTFASMTFAESHSEKMDRLNEVTSKAHEQFNNTVKASNLSVENKKILGERSHALTSAIAAYCDTLTLVDSAATRELKYEAMNSCIGSLVSVATIEAIRNLDSSK
ncbi:MAG: hypothetical protein AB7O96_17390 [Pseudobdellovibrionaceae bacterium]